MTGKGPAIDALKLLSGFAVRVLTGGGIAAIMLLVVFYGQTTGVGVLFSLISMASVRELYRIIRPNQKYTTDFLGIAMTGALPLAAAYGGYSGLIAATALGALLCMFVHCLLLGLRTSECAVTIFGAIYIGFMLSHLVLLHNLESGLIIALATILGVWANDVFAYLIGSAFGKHKLAPRISPKKSWEGFFGGAVFTVATWAALSLFPQANLELYELIVIGACIALTAVAGDLLESRIKREAGVKDSGRIFPGHGGMLDRFDSLIVVSPVAFYLYLLMGA
ncbi:MAG: phosphatidate cytidylyltransferase [Actinobacteria bacterium]|nr:phosphatidate cytidylyltransferase [Actinomycetota bacterium]